MTKVFDVFPEQESVYVLTTSNCIFQDKTRNRYIRRRKSIRRSSLVTKVKVDVSETDGEQ